MPQSDFLRAVERSGGLLQKAQNELEQTKRLAGAGDMAGAYESAFAFAARAEQLTLLARALPAYTGHPKAAERTEELLEEVVPVELGFTRQGWFCLRIPALLPRKERGSPSYLRDFLYPAMRRFFAGKLPCTYPDSVLIFRHIYDQRRPERGPGGTTTTSRSTWWPTSWPCTCSRMTLPGDAPITIAARPGTGTGRRFTSSPAML